MPGPATYRHKPTEVEAMQFTSENWIALQSWLHYNDVDFQMTPTHLLISTTQGDSRDIGLGGWVIKRKTPDGYEFYPVEAEVMNDYEDVDSAPGRVIGYRNELSGQVWHPADVTIIREATS